MNQGLRRIFQRAACLLLWVLASDICLANTGEHARFTVQRITQSPLGNLKLDAINDILQDKQGFLWLASENGLLRYDGLRTIKYQTEKDNPNSISSLYCWSLMEDHQGHIWIATENGLNEFDPIRKTFRHFLHEENNPQGLTHNFTTRVIESQDHKIYVASSGGLTVISEDRTTLKQITLESSDILLSNNVRTLFEDSEGNIWIGYYDTGLTRWTPRTQRVTHFTQFVDDLGNTIHISNIRDIAQDQQGEIWMGIYGGGVIRFSPATQTMQHFDISFAHLGNIGGIVWDILVDSKNSVWVATDKGGVAKFNRETQTFENIRHDPFDPNSILSDTIKDIFEDKQGNLWFATFPSGLNRHNPYIEHFETWAHHATNENSLSDSTILSLHQTRDKLLWVGTENGLNSIDLATRKITRYRPEFDNPNSLPAPAILNLAEDKEGNLWVGTWGGGLAKFNRKSQEFDRYKIGDGPHSVKSPYIWKVFIDNQERLWLGTETDGINLYQPERDQFKSYTHSSDERSISFNYVWEITQSHTGALWIGTQYGLDLFHPETEVFQHFKNSPEFQSLNDVRIQSVIEDRNGYVWAATQSRGIKRWDPKTESIINLSMSSGLPSNTVSSLIEDDQGSIWAGTIQGIVKVDPKTLTIEEIITSLDGIAGDNHNRNVAIKAHDGSLFFGSSSGLTRFHPASLELPDSSPEVTLTDIRIRNQPANVGADESPLKQDISVVQQLFLPHDANVITIEFASLDFNNLGKMRFSYMLEGLDLDWNDTANHNQAIYTNLDPGHYTFKVRAQNHSGHWSDNERSLSITIAPPAWLSPMAFLIYSLIAAGLIYLMARLVLLRLLANRLNEQVHTRTQELVKANSAKTVFLANMSHELRTPLNSIIGFSKRLTLKYENQLGKQGVDALDAIHRNGQHLLGLINDILDLSKIESGKMTLSFRPCNLKELITSCIADVQPAAAEKGLTLIAPSNYAHQVIRADHQRLTQILLNLLSNAIKYTDKGHIALVVDEQLHENRRYCTLSVIDTGKGIRKEDQTNLFKRFEQFDDESQSIKGFGTGLGLALVWEFSLLHGGFITCHSIHGEGSQFTVYLPLSELPKTPPNKESPNKEKQGKIISFRGTNTPE